MSQRTTLPALATALALFSACSTGPAADQYNADGTPSDAAVEAAITCDPIVEEYRDLLADYEAGLKEMIAAKEVDEARQKEWSARADELSKRVQARGERELGVKCWQEFNVIGQTYGVSIAKLGMELAMIQVGDKMDPAALEAMKKAMGQ